MSLNVSLILYVVLPALIKGSMVSGMIAIPVGGLIGLIAGARSRQIKRTLLPAIVGSFFGTLLIAILPIVSYPELTGGGYSGILLLLMLAVLVPLGAIAGALFGCLYGPKLPRLRQKRVLLILLIASYSLIAIVTYVRFSLHCIQYAWYCKPS